MLTMSEGRRQGTSVSGTAGTRRLRTDSGTVILHWLIVAAFVVVAGTGLRIASDEPALRWLTRFDSILPAENVWYWHVIAGLGLSAAVLAYVAYVVVARLGQRVRVDRNRWSSLLRRGKPRWSAIGVFVIWIGVGAFAVEMATGALLYAGKAGLALALHRDALWVCLALPALHIVAHYRSGGARQLLRICRPTRLVSPPPQPDVLALLAEHVRLIDDMRRGREPRSESSTNVAVSERKRRPLIAAAATGLAVVALGVSFEKFSGDTLIIPAVHGLTVGSLPVIDGDMSDPVWASAWPIKVLTDQGANFGGTGTSEVEVRAVHDGEHVYFAFVWEDPTRSLRHFPWIKVADGWWLGKTEIVPVKEERYVEDKFSVLFSGPTYPVVGAAIHLSPQPLSHHPASASGRGMHYTAPGSLLDVWVWRADHGGLAGYLDDAQFTGPKEPTAEQLAGTEPYAGGFGMDPGQSCFVDNVETLPDGSTVPLRLPRDLLAASAMIGAVHESPDISDEPGSKWWIDVEETEPFSEQSDRNIPVGAIIPSVVATCAPSGDRADVRGMARWSAGRWTLEVVRRIDTGSDQDLAIATGVKMWLAAFDHSATHHTRHLRPVTLELL